MPLSADDVRVLDLNSAWHGAPPSLLMQNAGRAIAGVALRRYAPKRVLVLCGPGNNGGDGAVAARHLAQAGVHVTVVYAVDPSRLKTGEASLAHRALDPRTVRVETHRSDARLRELASRSDLLLDALLGMGQGGDLRDPVRAMVRVANASRRPILSVDVPTGFGGRLQARPHATVTLHARKRGMTRANCGPVIVRPIGIPDAAGDVGPGDLAVHYPAHAPQSHKGQNGRLLVVAGGPYTGAPLLSATAALRVGVDLVRLYAPKVAAVAARAHSPDLIVHAGAEGDRLVPDDVPRIASLLPHVDAVLAGPGVGLDRATRAALKGVLEATQRRRVPMVLDADALAVAGAHPDLLRRRPVLATPHRREFSDLTRHSLPARPEAVPTAVARQAARLGATLLLKGPVDVVSDGRRTRSNRIHHAWMTAGGTGDVLAGLCGALTAKGLEPFRAGCAAAFLNGAAGLRCFEERSWGARASDLVEAVPRVLRDWVRA